jgi:lipopolysaccharide/colanic/teichoic acid biosynthesis glycosyltransferase
VPPAVRIAVIPDTPRLPDLDLLNLHFRRVVLLRVYGHLPVEGAQVRNMGGLVGIEYVNSLLRPHNRAVKRSLDLILGLLAFLLALPFIAAAAVAVKLASRGPAFFVQRRAGLDGRSVAVPKIRTMHVDAEARLEEHLASDPVLRAEWVEHMKLRQDPRLIPVVGPLLRRFSLDELPQLWSVVKGDMSLVGPRPFPDYHLEMFSASFRELRQRVRPGITGLWQVTLRSEGGIDEQEAADSYYIRNWSLWLDVYLLACTLGAVLRGKGAY